MFAGAVAGAVDVWKEKNGWSALAASEEPEISRDKSLGRERSP